MAHIRFIYTFYIPFYWMKDGLYMPRGKVKILEAKSGNIILETTIGVDYRFSIPRSIRSLVDPRETVRIIIKKAEEVKT